MEKLKAELISFIKNRAWEVENNIHDSIDFKNGYYLATEEIIEKLNKTATKPKTKKVDKSKLGYGRTYGYPTESD